MSKPIHNSTLENKWFLSIKKLDKYKTKILFSEITYKPVTLGILFVQWKKHPLGATTRLHCPTLGV